MNVSLRVRMDISFKFLWPRRSPCYITDVALSTFAQGNDNVRMRLWCIDSHNQQIQVIFMSKAFQEMWSLRHPFSKEEVSKNYISWNAQIKFCLSWNTHKKSSFLNLWELELSLCPPSSDPGHKQNWECWAGVSGMSFLALKRVLSVSGTKWNAVGSHDHEPLRCSLLTRVRTPGRGQPSPFRSGCREWRNWAPPWWPAALAQ